MLRDIFNKLLKINSNYPNNSSDCKSEDLSRAKRQEIAQKLIAEECDAIKELLILKNKSYGNSALEPINIFSKESASKQMFSRIDDKLSRIFNQSNFENEDTVKDLIGYLILSRVSEKYDKIIKGNIK